MMFFLLGAIGLMAGSVLNMVIYRLPIMLMEPSKHQQLNLFFPRSFCPHCRTMIPAYHNIPVLSFCLLRGRCRHCHRLISWRYPAIEIASMLLFMFAGWHFGLSLNLVFALVFIWLVLCLMMIDLDHQILPDSLNFSLIWLGLIANTQSLFTDLTDAVLSCVGAYLSLWLFIKLFYWYTKKVGMGHGDFKLFAAMGAWFGWRQLPFVLFSASLIGAVIGGIYLLKTQKDRTTPIPFGPFLGLAGLVSLFWGKQIVLIL